jgi:hypothetical protein
MLSNYWVCMRKNSMTTVKTYMILANGAHKWERTEGINNYEHFTI